LTAQRGVFDFLRSRGEEFLTQVSNELLGNPRFLKAMQAAMRGKEWVDEAVAQALRTMNVPSRTEFKRALSRIETLERELADVRREAAAARAAATAAPGPRVRTAAARRKTAVRKTAGKKKTSAAS
jgi:hypothetical protein